MIKMNAIQVHFFLIRKEQVKVKVNSIHLLTLNIHICICIVLDYKENSIPVNKNVEMCEKK